jgi:aspartate/methionine/tyrosine aminotransferase
LLKETGVLTVNGSGFDPVYGAGHFRVVTLPPIETQKEAFNEVERFMKKKTTREAPKRVGHG